MSLDLIRASGFYTGNGGTQSFTIGWQPAFMVLFGNKTNGPPDRRVVQSWKTPTMAADQAYRYSSAGTPAIAATGLTYTATGYQVTTNDTNENGVDYESLIIRGGPHVDFGTYTGNGGASQTITTGRQPSTVLVFGAAAIGGLNGEFVMKTATMAADLAFRTVAGSVASSASGMAITSSGFEAKSYGNTSAISYHYVAFYDLLRSSTENWSTQSFATSTNVVNVVTGIRPSLSLQCSNMGPVAMGMFSALGVAMWAASSVSSYATGAVTYSATGAAVSASAGSPFNGSAGGTTHSAWSLR